MTHGEFDTRIDKAIEYVAGLILSRGEDREIGLRISRLPDSQRASFIDYLMQHPKGSVQYGIGVDLHRILWGTGEAA